MPTDPTAASADRPLAGIHVLLVALNVPGPVAAAQLSRFGAAVTKVEPPAGDPLQRYAPSWYEELSGAARIDRLDLKSEGGRARLDALLDATDLLITSFRPSSLGRMGLSRERLAARFPRVAHVAIVGHAGDGAEVAGHDLTYQARAGAVVPPAMPRTLLADLAGAERATSAALALIAGQARGLSGGYVEIALEDALHAFMLPWRHGATRRGAPLGGGDPLYSLYATADGWIAVAALEPHFVRGLLDGLEIASDRRAEREPRLAETLRGRFASRTAAEWEAWAKERGLPIARVRSAHDEADRPL